MKKLTPILAIIVLVVMVGGTILWKATQPPPEPETIKIGAVFPLSGPVAFLGEGAVNGLLIAEQHANSGKWGESQFKIEIVAEDGGAVPKTSIGAYQKLVATDGVEVVITMLSGVSMALKPLAEGDGILLFANASHPRVTTDTRTTLRHSNVATQEAEMIAEAILNEKSGKTVSIIVQNDDYGIAFAETLEPYLKNAGIKVPDVIKYDKAGLDARLLAQKILTKKPNAIVILGVGKNLGLIIRRLREFKFKGQIYTGLGLTLVPGAIEAAGEHAADVVHTQFDFEVDNPSYKALESEYKSRFGHDLRAEALINYNTVKILWESLADGIRNPVAIAEKIKGMKEFQGVGEKMVINNKGDIRPAIQLETYKKQQG